MENYQLLYFIAKIVILLRMITFCKLDNACLSKFLLNCLDAAEVNLKTVGHLCCSHCKFICDCQTCIRN